MTKLQLRKVRNKNSFLDLGVRSEENYCLVKLESGMPLSLIQRDRVFGIDFEEVLLSGNQLETKL